jgi:hypothetical protein
MVVRNYFALNASASPAKTLIPEIPLMIAMHMLDIKALHSLIELLKTGRVESCL